MSTNGTGEVKRRRTERVRRMRPDYFNAMLIENYAAKKRRRAVSEVAPRTFKKKGPGRPQTKSVGDAPSEKRAKLIAKSMSKPTYSCMKEDDSSGSTSNSNGGNGGEEDMYANIPAEKSAQLSIILDEINHKMGTQRFQPT